MNRPTELSHYLSTNDVFPPSGLPTLDSYLSQLTTAIETLGSDINHLQAILDSKKEEERRLQVEYRDCASIKNPMRRLPLEILGLIFRFAIGDVPFNRYIPTAYLRGVCSSWRKVATTTPGLWTGLTIDLDQWSHSENQDLGEETLPRLFQKLYPWLPILSHTHPFHLRLISELPSDDSDADEIDTADIDTANIDRQRMLVQHLLSMAPPPGSLGLETPLALLATIGAASIIVTKVEISEDATPALKGFTISETQFPNLEALEITGLLDFDEPTFPHSSLQTLHLVHGLKEEFFFHHILQSLPSLRELRLDDPGDMGLSSPPTVLGTAYVHQCLETLIIVGENYLFALANVSFPHLRLLEISGFGSTVFKDDVLESHIRPDVFARSSSQPLLVSLCGDFYQLFLPRVLACLPPNSYLQFDVSAIIKRPRYDSWGYYEDNEDEDDNAGTLPISIESDNIEKIFCGSEAVKLWWLLDASPARKQSPRPLTMYLPTGCDGWEEGYLRRDALLEFNFELETLSNKSLDVMIRTLAPTLSRHAANWWGTYIS
ncbi:hypothetical protein BKA70DRAFT_1267355 [Coprinopsis sp. MPI-PUGE-AT-0042]|nr:hypothetical protein BKA70DRAFT_1267355 [Coprinopsis sp. MPI-PUGE-AT-0042]